jgi:hypothetical protein
MMSDLNEYYPACNLPRLYRVRGRDDDAALAHEAEVLTIAACRRALQRNMDDEWVRPTLLGMSFYRGDVAEAQSLLPLVARDGTAAWKLDTTLLDLETCAAAHEGAIQVGLTEVLLGLQELLRAGPAIGTLGSSTPRTSVDRNAGEEHPVD